MRNISVYKINKQEILGVLEDFQSSLNPDLIGDMRPFILEIVKDIVDKTDFSKFDFGFNKDYIES
jgi:hypothetical protein